MLSPVVQTVVQMGFDADLVESLVQTRYLLTGQQYTSVSDLVSDVLQAEQEDGQRGPQSRGKAQLYVSSATLSDLIFPPLTGEVTSSCVMSFGPRRVQLFLTQTVTWPSLNESGFLVVQ